MSAIKYIFGDPPKKLSKEERRENAKRWVEQSKQEGGLAVTGIGRYVREARKGK